MLCHEKCDFRRQSMISWAEKSCAMISYSDSEIMGWRHLTRHAPEDLTGVRPATGLSRLVANSHGLLRTLYCNVSALTRHVACIRDAITLCRGATMLKRVRTGYLGDCGRLLERRDQLRRPRPLGSAHASHRSKSRHVWQVHPYCPLAIFASQPSPSQLRCLSFMVGLKTW